jgi:hypothetical protein
MAKQKKYNLEIQNEFDFEMFGISSHHNDYRLAWCLNAELGLGFEQSPEPYIISTVKKGDQINFVFPMYEYHDEENLLDYFLIKNKHEGKHLISEKPTIDFFLFILERGMIDYTEFGVKLRGVSSILAVFPFEPEEFSSSEKLIFN